MVQPSRRSVFVLSVLLLGVGCRAVGAAEAFVYHHENVMGTSLELRVLADSEASARRAESRVLGEIDRLSAIFSSYDPRSEFSRWQAGPKVPTGLAPELVEVLRACDHWREVSGGAFEPRVEALSRVWTQSAREGRLPTPSDIAGAKALMSRPAWRLDSEALTAERLTDCPISLNAIAKGAIIERACDAARQADRGVRGLVLNVGGDMRVCGELARTVGVADPKADSETSEPIAYVEVRDRAVSTSGKSRRGFLINGRWYSHKIDPQSGAPVDRVASATVIADRSADADALATIFNVLPPDESVRLANALPGAACLIVASDGQVTKSDGWHRYERPRPITLALNGGPDPPAPASKTEQVKPWGDEFELLVKFEINSPEENSRRYRRPYVVIWLEDKDGVTVRTLVLWVSLGGPGPERWLPDLKRWYRDDKANGLVAKKNMIYTTAQATRMPGKYTAIWDGKDDYGKPLDRGEYTFSLEAAREHGTYQIIRKPIRIDDTPFTEEFKGNVEIKSASIEYRRKPQSK